MKTILIALILGLLAVCVAAGGASSPKPVDTYADHKDFCYKKCTHYKTLKGKCVDFEWVGTKKECCEWKTVGKGKCAEYKKSSKCVKYSKAKRVCLGHGYRQVCNKVTKEKLCAKYEWKKLCKGHGKNHKCDQYAYHFICTKYDQSERCAAETYIPKIKYFFKKRCARYTVDQYCAKYKKISKTVAKWIPITKKHYLGYLDTYYHQVLEKKFRTICVAYAKKKTCAKFEHVKFAKKVGYIKKCVKFIKKKFCVAKKKVRFCTKFSPSKFCNLKERVRICKAFKKQHVSIFTFNNIYTIYNSSVVLTNQFHSVLNSRT